MITKLIETIKVWRYWFDVARYEYYIDQANQNGEQRYIKTRFKRGQK